MKKILFLFLFPCLAFAQYQGNANQKITLGEQTTADGLVFRGVANDTNVITPFSDTSAYIILDTVNSKFYHYNRTTTFWALAGGGGDSGGVTSFSAGTTGLTPSTATTGAVTLGGTLAVANGGTGSASYQSTAVPYYIQGTKLSNDTSIIKVDTINKRVILSGLAIYDGNGTGLNNVVLGNLSMLNNTTGNTNVALGSSSLQNNTTGTENLAIGSASLNLNTTGQFNIGIGSQSLSKNTTALRNIGIGRTSLEDHKTGDDNIGIGYLALANDTISAFNLAIGNNAMVTLIGNASNNTSIGHGSMLLKTSGSGNVALGHYAGYLNTTGSNNIWIGEVYTGSSNTASNEVTVGNSSTTSYRIFQSGWTNVSDVRDKTDILPLNYGLNFIEKLKPVTYTWNMRDGGKIGIADIGFIAQDLEKTQIDLGINVPNLVNTENPEQYGISTINLLPIIVKALQEANDKIKSLEQKILNLENK